MMACAPESVFTPRTTRGGVKADWVTQLTVAAATAAFLPSAVKTYRPYGIIRNAVFLASSFIDRPFLSKTAEITTPLYSRRETPRPTLCMDGTSVTLALTPFISQTGAP